ncbi:tRNA pseudouridine(55) synthase TruB [Sediminibacillus albus]|uniref:tRNA pseudouridine synthase B n=1 Tax=Sediminibacillus albus TaxID=407036 RepID=A0A1G8VZY1_9BACI|nr:tRNA pseudouridine(55) synthase TruB [Sediminibacillus albus]SDJ71549.1 tRNA pseudouridine55 synthase [Sediminibacillus albus]
MDGILPLWKPRGLTSHDCVARLRRLYGTKKVGHTGTLDPEVEGVLPICIGQATKLVPYLTETKKTYIAEVTLGAATETEDSHGAIIESVPVNQPVGIEKINSVLTEFHGEVKQTPPMYSAVKVQGRKLYEYARQGLTIERPERTIRIFRIELLSNEEAVKNGTQQFQFKVECSKGTYIRTLCTDIGSALGYPAHMSDLVRTQTGSFTRENSYTLEDVEQARALNTHLSLLLPLQAGVEHLDVLYVEENIAAKIYHGQKLKIPSEAPSGDSFRVQLGDKLLAIYQYHPTEHGMIKPLKVFHYD